jgi:chaperonin cofactor prefoldin
MSSLACEEPERKISSAIISDAEIYNLLLDSSSEEDKKPSAESLHERIEDLEFELECCKADSKDTDKRMRALRMLLQAIDLQRFEEKNKKYLNNILEKIKNLT